MKIAFVTVGAYMDQEDYSKGDLLGTENQVFGLAKELEKKGHEVFIIRRWFESKIETVKNVKVVSFKSINNSSNGLIITLFKLCFSRNVAKFLKGNNFDMLILIDPYTSYFLLDLPIPKITITHNEIPIDLLEQLKGYNVNKIKKKLLRQMQKRLFEKSDGIVALNSTIKNYLDTKNYKTKLIPNGIEIENYVPNYSDDKYILFGGRFVSSKRIDDLINAYSFLDEEFKKNYKLIIIGFGPEKYNLERLVSEYKLENRVEIVPWIHSKEFIKKMSRCAVFVLPSLYETFGIVSIEAMALGKPTILSDTDGSNDIVKHGCNGFLFKKGDVNQLNQYLKTLLQSKDLRNEMGQNARRTVEENFTFDKISQNYLNFFNEIARYYE